MSDKEIEYEDIVEDSHEGYTPSLTIPVSGWYTFHKGTVYLEKDTKLKCRGDVDITFGGKK